MVSLHYCFIHTYLNDGNIAWASTPKTNLKKYHHQQKQAVGTVINENMSAPSNALFTELSTLNIYNLNFPKLDFDI